MKRWILLSVLLCSEVPAWSQSWQRLGRVKAGATIVVQTQPWKYGPVGVDRCDFISVDPDTLTCIDHGRGRLVFPAQEIDAVYEVHRSHVGLIGALLVIGAAAALIIGGGVTGNSGAILYGFLILLFGTIATTHVPLQGWSPPPPPPEHHRLVYLRPAP